MKTCTCPTYWERAAKKLARQHIKLLHDILTSSAPESQVKRSIETATKILKGKP